MGERARPRRRAPSKRSSPTAKGPRAKAAFRALTFLVFVLSFGALLSFVYLLTVYPHTEGPGEGASVRLEWTGEEDHRIIAERLYEHGLIDSPFRFSLWLRIRSPEARAKPIDIILHDDLSPADLAMRILEGFGDFRVRVTIPEGLNRFDIARRLESFGATRAEDFIRATEDRAFLQSIGLEETTAEGYLFPDTYQLLSDTDAERIVRRMVRTFRVRTSKILEEEAETLRAFEAEGYGFHQLVILASIVEKEAAVREEQRRIAGVFWNRLRSEAFRPPQRLQADPTVSYGCIGAPNLAPSCAEFRGAITRAMLNDAANPYNTYRHGGLPPGPISNPGLAALRAVIRPERHNYFFFVAKGRGRHVFSEDLETHQRAVDRYIRKK